MLKIIYDLSKSDSLVQISSDVCVIGAGVAGILISIRLRQLGFRVIVLESGGRHQHEERHPLNEVVQLGEIYKGATTGRFRCLGGTSTRWGGALIPFLKEDLEAKPHLGLSRWPVDFSALSSYISDIERIFCIDSGPFHEEFVEWFKIGRHVPIGDPNFLARFAKWPTFKNRNLSNLFGDQLATDANLNVWLNATVINFGLQCENNQVASADALSMNERALSVTASAFIVCAGAIESTRLLLCLDRKYNQAIFGAKSALGKYFHDHISTAAAQIRAIDVNRLNRMAGFRFVGKSMRSLRFELSPAAARKEEVASAFGHVTFKTNTPTVFDTLRSILQARQKHIGVSKSDLIAALRDLPSLLRMAIWRSFYKQLYWPRPANYYLNIVVEQLPHCDNRISLSPKVDRFGLPLAAICWNIFDNERKTLGAYARLFSEFWRRQNLDEIGGLEWLFDLHDPNFSVEATTDIFHPGGTTRMGGDFRSSVVDSNLRTHAINNLWVLSTSSFPSGASANPTMMLMLFALRLADHLATSRLTTPLYKGRH